MRRLLLSNRCRLALSGVLAVTAFAALLWAWPSPAPPPLQADRQMPPVTFRVEINYVEVDATVVDRKGDFVDSLQASDFQVFEDGKPQAISSFGLVKIPLERAEAPLFARQPIEPDVQSNARPFDGRVYLIVLDGLHTDPLHTPWVRSAAKKFIQNSLGANDVAAVVSTQGSAAQDFTGNKRLLLAAVDRFMGSALASATLNKIDDYNRNRGMGTAATTAPRDADDMQRAFNASTTLRSIRQLSDFMSGVRGRRKALVLFSEGIDYDITDVIGNQGASSVIDDSRDAIGAATRSNVSIYSVDPRGLSADLGFDAGTAGPPIDADPTLKLDSTGMMNELRLQRDSLRVLAEETGGFAVVNSNDFASAFERIQKDNSSYYVLGYYPTNERRDGKFRKIDVKVNRPGVEIRSRRGYMAPRGKAAAAPTIDAKEGTPPVLRELLSSPLPIPGLRISATAAAFKGTGGVASINLVVQADGRDLSFTEKEGKFEETLDMAVIAVDESGGKPKGGLNHLLNMPLMPATYQQVARNGLRITSRMDLPPGHYQLRIGVVETNGKRAGSVHLDLDVPDFSSEPLMMSGVVLTSALAGQVRTAVGNPNDELRKALPGPPTVSREFRSGEELALVAEVYDNQGRAPHTVDITTSLLADDGREVYKHEDQRSSAELGGTNGGYGHTARIPLQGVAPGLYVVKVEARSRLGKSPSVSREIQIRVVR
jgi:VWFA-related protein